MRAMAAVSAAKPEARGPGGSLAAAARAAGAPRAASTAPPPPPSVELVPVPAFVVKTRDQEGRKVFVNVCGSALVAAPGDWANGQARARIAPAHPRSWHPALNAPRAQVPLAVKEALEKEADASPGDAPPAALRLPLACGAPRSALDAEGGGATVVDVVYSADVAAAAAGDVRLKAFLVGSALAHVGAKHGWQLDAKYKLPRRRYFDEPVRPQRVRADGAGGAAPRITELPAGGAPAPPAPAQADDADAPSFALRVAPARPAAAKAAAAKPFSFAAPAAAPAAASASATSAATHTLEFEGRPCAALLVRVPLPASAAADGGAAARATLRRGELRVAATADAASPLAAVPLPFEVDAARASAWVEEAAPPQAPQTPQTPHAPPALVLCVRLPVRAYREVAHAAAAAASSTAGAGKGALDLSAASYLELIA